MATESQISANQANSQKSTGPVTEEGKAASSKNRFHHGLTNGHFHVLHTESGFAYMNLVEALNQEHKPATPTEELLVQQMVESYWLRQRAQQFSERCFNYETGEILDPKQLALYMRYETMHDRAFHKSLATLLKLRSERQKLEIGFEREKRYQSLHPAKAQRLEMEITMLQIRELKHDMTQTEAAMRAEKEKASSETPKAA